MYSYKSIYCANDFANQIRHVADQADEERVEVQRIEDTLNNVDEVSKSDDELKIDIDIGNRDVDLLHCDLDTGVNLHKACNLCVEI